MLGNWINSSSGSTVTSDSTHSKNELTSVGSTSQSFDNDGNTLIDATTGNHYNYDAWNRLVTVKNSSGGTIAGYTYTPDGYRVTATEGGSTTASYYSDQWQVIETRQGSTVKAQNVWGIDYVNDLVLRDDDSTSGSLGISGSGLGERLYAQHDANWDTTALTNTTGAVQERFVYGPYGIVTVLTASGSVTTDAYHFGTLYQGGAIDTVTGLYKFQRRDYSATQGRWIEQDAIGSLGGVNRYAFCDASPITKTDDSGLRANWHHLLPQAVFDADFFSRHSNLKINIDESKWGWIMDSKYHTGSDGIHSAGWNTDWKAWVNSKEAEGVKITEDCIKEQLHVMMTDPKYSDALLHGNQAPMGYSSWSKLDPIEKELQLSASEAMADSGSAWSRWDGTSVAAAGVVGAISALTIFGNAGSDPNMWYRKALLSLLAKNQGQPIDGGTIDSLTHGNLYQNADNAILIAGSNAGGLEGTGAALALQTAFEKLATSVGDALRH